MHLKIDTGETDTVVLDKKNGVLKTKISEEKAYEPPD